MRTTITLRDDLLKLARQETKGKSITAAVNQALEDWARRKRVERIRSMAGKVHFDGHWEDLRKLEVKKTERLHGKHPR